jgi:hypothetical protein
MDTDKLVKAIQIIVKEELKTIVPKLVKEGVKKEMTKLLKENKQLRETLKSRKPQQPTFMDTPVVESRTQPQRQLSNNPLLNEVLNETQGFNSSGTSTYAGAPTEVSTNTLNFNSTSAPGGVEGMRAQMAAKMGLSDMSMGAQPTGLGVQTGNTGLDKALNRDYSGLMKAIDKKKGPFRPGM